MTTLVCIIGDYHTWREEKGYEGERNRKRVALKLYRAEARQFLKDKIGLWKFFFGQMFDACKKVDNNRGRLEKVIACVRVSDNGMDAKHRTLYYIQENGGKLTYVIPQPHPITARDKLVTQYVDSLELTAEHISKTAPKIVDFIKNKEAKRS